MASKQLPRGTPEFEMFGEFYKMYQEFHEVEESDEYWDGFIQRSHEIISKYGEVPFCRQMIRAFSDYQEYVLKERRRNNVGK